MKRLGALAWVALCTLACAPSPHELRLPRELRPAPRIMGPEDSLYSPQPHRDRPRAIVQAGRRLFVALTGTDTQPGRELAVLDADTLAVQARVEVGLSPVAMAVHPSGQFVAVACRFASYVPIVDVETLRVVSEVPSVFYNEGIAFSPDGTWVVIANRWKDSLLRWRVQQSQGGLRVELVDPVLDPWAPIGVPMMPDPRRVVFMPGGEHVLVTSETSLRVSLVHVESGEVVATHSPNAPVTDAVVVGDHVVVLHTGSGSGHPPDSGFDGDFDGAPGDGTANVTFQDVQNEIDVLRARDLSLEHRYTSDTICCGDYRDVDPDHPQAGLELRPVDAWPPERVAFLPPRDTWIVAGAMPERAIPFVRPGGGSALGVVFGGSSEVQTFDVDPASGALHAVETAQTGLRRTGHGAIDGLFQPEHERLVLVERLAESVRPVSLSGASDALADAVVVGDVSAGEFPATDAELGEAFNTMTALFSIDGDQTCVHCHRDGTPIAKPVSMPLLEIPVWGLRNVMAYRGAYDTRPWFVEAAMDEDNFFPVINEFARRENFCCEQSDVRIWSHYPTRDACELDPALEGCRHVTHCEEDPPPECEDRFYGGDALTRERHFREAAQRVLGRDVSFGDALYGERLGPDGEIVRVPIPLGFDGITRALGLFLLVDSRLLPNPNAALPRAEVALGAELFGSPRTGCATCHPAPTFATAVGTPRSAATGPLTFPYVVTPVLDPERRDADRVNPAFLGTFPDARQTDDGLRVGSTSLRGLWDRSRFLHHGLARSLREVLATPGHAALRPGERGFNEVFGQADTHGGVSSLSEAELRALVSFLETL